MHLTAGDLALAISRLPKRRFSYINQSTTTKVEVACVTLPHGPISIRRHMPQKGGGKTRTSIQTISTSMLWRVANAIGPNTPLNIDRILGASYNTRSALETLLACTPEFYVCRPGRIENTDAAPKVKKGHKHLLWDQDTQHKNGTITEIDTAQVISEIPSTQAVYEAIVLPDLRDAAEGVTQEIQHRHAQIQAALVEVGQSLGYKTWIALNDRGIIYNQKRLAEMDGVVNDLNTGTIISPFGEAVQAALRIDCIWFRNATLMPAVIEVEHTTGVKSGLTRMKNLQDKAPGINTRFVVAAADADRDLVFRSANMEQFKSLTTLFFPYSAIEELNDLCKRRKLQGVTDSFLNSFMECCVN